MKEVTVEEVLLNILIRLEHIESYLESKKYWEYPFSILPKDTVKPENICELKEEKD